MIWNTCWPSRKHRKIAKLPWHHNLDLCSHRCHCPCFCCPHCHCLRFVVFIVDVFTVVVFVVIVFVVFFFVVIVFAVVLSLSLSYFLEWLEDDLWPSIQYWVLFAPKQRKDRKQKCGQIYFMHVGIQNIGMCENIHFCQLLITVFCFCLSGQRMIHAPIISAEKLSKDKEQVDVMHVCIQTLGCVRTFSFIDQVVMRLYWLH